MEQSRHARGVVGREHELEAAAEFVEELERGPAALVLEGAAGIGKTTLWRAAAALAEARGFRVLATRPSESERSLPLAGFADLFGTVDAELVTRLPPPQRTALDAALLRGGEGPPSDPRAVFAGALSVVQELVKETPVVLAADDVQWLDPPTIRVLQFIARRVGVHRIGLILSWRLPRDGGTADLFTALDHPSTKRVQVGPLTLAATHQLLRERLDRPFPRRTLLRIQEASGGNPFFALEIARALGSSDLHSDEPLPVPDDVQALVRHRIKRLSKATRRALVVAAALSEPTVRMVGPSIGPALRGGLIEESARGRLAFTHPLYASAVYEATAPEERRKIHHELADRLHDVQERARQLALAVTSPDEQVAAELDRAADGARARGAPELAAELQERAFELTPSGDRIAADRRALAMCEDYLHAGALGRARSLLKATLDRAEDRELRVRALHLLAQVRFREESVTEAIELLETAAAEAGDDPELHTPIELDLVFAFFSVSFDFEAARHHAEALVSYTKRLADDALLAEALAVVTMSEFLLGGGVDEAKLDRALALEDPEHRVPVQFRPTLIAGFLAFYTGRFDRARSFLYPLAMHLRERGEEADLPLLLTTIAWLECSAGNLTAARSLSDEAYEAAVLNESETMVALSLVFAALVETWAGDVEAARRRLDAATQAIGHVGYGLAALWTSATLGLLELSLGDTVAAQRVLEPLTQFVDAQGIVEPVRAFFVPDAVEALVAGGDVESAERLTAQLLDRGRELDRPWALATGRRCRALVLAATNDARSALLEIEQALEEHERLPMPGELGRTLLVKGQIERRFKKKSAAKESLERARAIFDDIGAGLWAQRAQSELDRVGLRRAASDELTETERRVAELAASGLTNREVAAQLFMSPKTVEANLARVYRKLGIRSRAELGARLAAGERAPAGR